MFFVFHYLDILNLILFNLFTEVFALGTLPSNTAIKQRTNNYQP